VETSYKGFSCRTPTVTSQFCGICAWPALRLAKALKVESSSFCSVCASLTGICNMNVATPVIRCWRAGPALSPIALKSRFLSSSLLGKAYYSDRSKLCLSRQKTYYYSTKAENATSATIPSRSVWRLPFWKCRRTWRRAGVNTLRCLVGCTVGDFSALWMLQTYYPELGMTTIMGASSKFL
jgi:hypothetical protein